MSGNHFYFQAIGVIDASVIFENDYSASITLDTGENYKLLYVPKYFKTWKALRKKVLIDGKAKHRLIVYPRIIHFPRKEHVINFRLIGFQEQSGASNVFQDLQNFDFIVAGIWQTILGKSCASVYRNYSDSEKEKQGKLDTRKRIQNTKAQHIPIANFDLVPPYRFIRGKENNASKFFIRVKARFEPQKNTFAFNSLITPPVTGIPKYLQFKNRKRSQNKKVIDSPVKKSKSTV